MQRQQQRVGKLDWCAEGEKKNKGKVEERCRKVSPALSYTAERLRKMKIET